MLEKLYSKRAMEIYGVLTTALLLAGIIFGFINPGSNLFTYTLFFILFWLVFQILTIPFFGNIFCGICPFGYLGRKLGKKHNYGKLPNALRSPVIGTALLLAINWLFVYFLPGWQQVGILTSLFFSTWLILSVYFSVRYGVKSFCEGVCPIGAVSTVFGQMGSLNCS